MGINKEVTMNFKKTSICEYSPSKSLVSDLGITHHSTCISV